MPITIEMLLLSNNVLYWNVSYVSTYTYTEYNTSYKIKATRHYKPVDAN
jgi:hypothetical protein